MSVNKGLQNMYIAKKQATLEKIQTAIDDIQADGKIVTKKELMELTGLSSGTFSQDYVKELLEKNCVCQFRKSRKPINDDKKEQTKDQIIASIEKDNKSAMSKIQNLTIALEKKEKECNTLRTDIERINNDYLMLKGKYQQLLEYLEVLGADIHKLNLI